MSFPSSPLSNSEAIQLRCMLFPTYGNRTVSGNGWVVHVRGWAFFEPRDSRKRRVALSLARTVARVSDAAAANTLRDRTALFFSRNASPGTRILVRVTSAYVKSLLSDHAEEFDSESGDCEPCGLSSWTEAATTSTEGHFEARIDLSDNNLSSHLQDYETMLVDDTVDVVVRLEACLPGAGELGQYWHGEATLIAPTGFSVISDIDDTIKHTSVTLGKRQIIRRTFFDDLEQVDGMPELYRRWRTKTGCRFHYVSNSPWQLLPLLQNFFHAHAFPHHSVHLRQFSMLSGRYDPIAHKQRAIERIMTDFPERKFHLVGDSGECDMELYAGIGHRFPGQIVTILIRDVTTPVLTDKMSSPAIETTTGLGDAVLSPIRSSSGCSTRSTDSGGKALVTRFMPRSRSYNDANSVSAGSSPRTSSQISTLRSIKNSLVLRSTTLLRTSSTGDVRQVAAQQEFETKMRSTLDGLPGLLFQTADDLHAFLFE